MRADDDHARSQLRHMPIVRSTHYHTDYVFPYWAPKLANTATVPFAVNAILIVFPHWSEGE